MNLLMKKELLKMKKYISDFTIVSTNSRSITPKIDCFIEYLNELNSSIAFLSETWLTDSEELKHDIDDLERGTGYGLLCKNRPPNSRGYSTGGVAIAYKKSQINLSEVCLPGNEYELLFAVGCRTLRESVLLCVHSCHLISRWRWHVWHCFSYWMAYSNLRGDIKTLLSRYWVISISMILIAVSYTHLTLPTIYSV